MESIKYTSECSFIEGTFGTLEQFKEYFKGIANINGQFALNFSSKQDLLAPQHIELFMRAPLMRAALKALISQREIMSLTNNWEASNGIVLFKLTEIEHED